MNRNHGESITTRKKGRIQSLMPVMLTLIFSICAGGLAKVRDTKVHSPVLYSCEHSECVLYTVCEQCNAFKNPHEICMLQEKENIESSKVRTRICCKVMISEHKERVITAKMLWLHWLQYWHLLFHHRSDCWPVSHGNERQSKIHCNSKWWSFGLKKKMCTFNSLKLPCLAFHRVQWFKLALRGG